MDVRHRFPPAFLEPGDGFLPLADGGAGADLSVPSPPRSSSRSSPRRGWTGPCWSSRWTPTPTPTPCWRRPTRTTSSPPWWAGCRWTGRARRPKPWNGTGRHPKFAGVRHPIHDDPDPDWVIQDSVVEGLGLLAAAGLPFDVVAALPRHLEHVAFLAERVPGLRLADDRPPGQAADRGEGLGAVGVADRPRRRAPQRLRQDLRVPTPPPTPRAGPPRTSGPTSSTRSRRSAPSG